MCAADVGINVVSDHEDIAGRQLQTIRGGQEEAGVGFAEDEWSAGGGVLQGGDERRDVERDAIGGKPVAGHAQRDELGVGIVVEQAEGAVERGIVPVGAQVANDDVGSSLFGMHLQAGEAGELAAGGRADEESDGANGALTKPLGGGGGWGDEVAFAGGDAEVAEFFDEGGAVTRRRVGGKQMGDGMFADPVDGFGGAGDEFGGVIEDTVHVEEDATHGLMVADGAMG